MSDGLWRGGGRMATGILQIEHLQEQTKNGNIGELLGIETAQPNGKGFNFNPLSNT